VATALAAVGVQQGGAQASPLDLPATITPFAEVNEAHVQGLESFEGFWSTYDQVNQRFLTNHVKLWATHDRCGMTVSSHEAGVPGRRIEFEDPKIAWAFTCMMRLMRNQSHYTIDLECLS